ncbi:MAG: Ig-like domain-containing protein, partial [Nitrospiria bacterium]
KVIVNEAEAVITGTSFTSNPFDLIDYNYGLDYLLEHPLSNTLVTAWAMDDQGRIGSDSVSVLFRDLPVPTINVLSPLDGAVLTESPVTFTAQVFDATQVTLNGQPAQVVDNHFSGQMDLVEGLNTFTMIARNPGKAAAKTVTVNFQPSAALVSLKIEAETTQLALGHLLQLKAVGTRADGSTLDLTNSALWSSSAPSVASVNNTGFVTSLKRGITTIHASFQGLSAHLGVGVGSRVLQTIAIAHEPSFQGILVTSALKMGVGGSQSLIALGTFSDGALIDLKKNFFPHTWSSSNPDVATIDAITGRVIAIRAGTTELSVASGSVTGTTTLTVSAPPMHLFITDPPAGSTVNRSEVTVTGTVITGAAEVGITVNGLPADVFGNRFVVHDVPLEAGENTLKAEGIDANGATASSEVTVSASPTADGITLRSNIASGVAPLEINLEIDSTFGAFPTSTLSFSGPALPEITQVNPARYRVKLTTEGIYTFTAEVTDDAGTTHRDTATVVVLNFAEMDALLRAKWEGMETALLSGDIDGAMTFFSNRTQERYREIFLQIQSVLPQTFSGLEGVHLLSVQNDTAEMEAVRIEGGIRYSYPIVFIRDERGAWTLWGF